MEFGTGSERSGGSRDGIAINEVTILKAEIVKSKYEDIDVSLKITADTGKVFDGNPYHVSIFVDGRFKKQDGVVVGAGSVTRILKLLNVCNVSTKVKDTAPFIAPEALAALEGKKVLRLRYNAGIDGTGKKIMRNYTTFASTNDPDAAKKLKEAFLADVAARFVKDYTPVVEDAPAEAAVVETEAVAADGPGF